MAVTRRWWWFRGARALALVATAAVAWMHVTLLSTLLGEDSVPTLHFVGLLQSQASAGSAARRRCDGPPARPQRVRPAGHRLCSQASFGAGAEGLLFRAL